MQNQEFTGIIRNSTIESKKLAEGRSMRCVVIGDLHAYTNNTEKARRLAEAIKLQNPDYIFIAGDIFHGGNAWNGGSRLNKFKEFIDIISEAAPVFITWGNHDLRGMTPKNQDTRIRNLRELEDVRKGKVFPLYNDSAVSGDMEVIGYVPSFELMEGKKYEGLPIQIHGIAHDRFIKEYEEKGVKISHPELVTAYIGHDPHLIAVSENGIGLGSLSLVDIFFTGHLHGGYKPVLELLGLHDLPSCQYDCGWVEQPTLVDKDGNRIKKPFWPPFYGKTNLCRGIVFFDDEAQQKVWLSPEGIYHINASSEVNKQIWTPVFDETALKIIRDKDLHAMVITEGVAPGFLPTESMANIDVVDISGPKMVLKR